MKKKDQNKGFTLVELIVVLVILAILAAILVPALLGYIDQAKGKQTVLNAKSALTAAQAEMSNIYASKTVTTTGSEKGLPSCITSGTNKSNVIKMADIYDATINANGTIKASKLIVGCDSDFTGSGTDTDKKAAHKAFTITYVEYEDDTGHLYFDGATWNEWDATGASAAKGSKKIHEIIGSAS